MLGVEIDVEMCGFGDFVSGRTSETAFVAVSSERGVLVERTEDAGEDATEN